MLDPLGGIPYAGSAIRMGSGSARLFARLIARRAKRPSGSADAQKHQIVGLLAQSGRRVVVLVDDIDRLRHNEILEVMRPVRLVGDFPNMVYVLAFDRHRVVEALGQTERDGQAYLEKIVQAAFDVPRAAAIDLSTMLADVVNTYLSGAPHPGTQQDLDNVFVRIIRPLFATAREVRRYANCLAMAFDLCGGEVATIDLLALEAVRSAAPNISERLHDSFDLLTLLRDGLRNNEQAPERIALEKLVECAGAHGTAIRYLLEYVFPPSQQIVSNHLYDRSEQRRWLKHRRVAYPDVFRFYLDKRIAPGHLPHARVLQAVRGLEEGIDAESLVAGLSGDEVEHLLERLAAHADDVPPEKIEGALQVVAGLEHRLREGTRGPFDILGGERAVGLLAFALLRARV